MKTKLIAKEKYYRFQKKNTKAKILSASDHKKNGAYTKATKGVIVEFQLLKTYGSKKQNKNILILKLLKIY